MSREIIEGILRVEEWNDQFRKANPNGKYPLCKPITGDSRPARCDRCCNLVNHDRPCPAVPRENRWGPDYEGEGNSLPIGARGV